MGLSEHPPGLQIIADGSLPGVTHLAKSLPRLTQWEACEYAGCICVVIVPVPL